MPFDKRFWISFVAIFIVAMVLGFVTHGLLLAGDYEALTPNVMRTMEDQQTRFPYQLLAHVLLSFGFVWLYREGRSADKAWMGQGVRFGIAFALAATVPIYLIYRSSTGRSESTR